MYNKHHRTPSEALQIPSKLFETQDKLIPPGKSSGRSADPAVDHLFQGSQVIRQLTTAEEKNNCRNPCSDHEQLGNPFQCLVVHQPKDHWECHLPVCPRKSTINPTEKKKSTSAFAGKMRKTSPTKSQKSHLKSPFFAG